jgi:hypothetical protein
MCDLLSVFITIQAQVFAAKNSALLVLRAKVSPPLSLSLSLSVIGL